MPGSLKGKSQVTSRRRILLVLVVMGLLPGLLCQPTIAAFTEEELEDGAITLTELVEMVLESNHRLISAEAQARRYQLRIPLVENLTEPLLAFYYLDFPVGNMSGGFTERINQAQAGPAQKVHGEKNTKGGRGKILTGRDMVEDQALWYESSSKDLRLQLIRETREKFYQLHFTNQIISVFEQSLETLDNLIRVSDALYAVGKTRQKDVLAAQGERYQFLARLLELRQQRLELSNELNYLAARLSTSLLIPIVNQELNHNSMAPLKYPAANLISGLLQNRPLLKGYQALASRFRSMRGMVQMYFNREVRSEAMFEADSGFRATKAKFNDVYNKVIADILTTEADLEKNRELARLFGRVLVPQTRQRYQASLADLQVGGTEYRETLQTLLDLNRYQIEYYQALSGYQTDLAKLEGLSGARLDVFPPVPEPEPPEN